MIFKLILEPAQISGQWTCYQGISGTLQGIALHPESCPNLDIDVFQRAHDLVTQQGLKLIYWIQAGQFPDITRNRVTLGDLHIIQVKGRHLIQRGGLTDFCEILGCKPVVFKRNSADMHGEPCRLCSSTGEVKIG